MSEILSTLMGLPRHFQLAFAAACVDRVIPIYAWQRGYDTLLRQGVEIVWGAALGSEPDEDEVSRFLVDLKSATPSVNIEGGRFGPSMSVCVSLAYAIDAIYDSPADNAAQAAESAVEAVVQVVDYLTEKGNTSEGAWQEAAVRLLAQSVGQAPSRQIFSRLEDSPPAWLALLGSA